MTSGASARLASRADILAALALAAFVSVLALGAHAWYASHTGDTAYFKSAYNEDSYLRLATEEGAGGHRGLSSLALRALASMVDDATTALIVADAVFPALAALAAFALAATTVRSPGSAPGGRPAAAVRAGVRLSGQHGDHTPAACPWGPVVGSATCAAGPANR